MCLKMKNATLKRTLAGIVIGLLMVSIVAMGCGESGGEKLTIGGDVPEIAQDATLIDLEVIRGDSELLKETGEVLGALNRSLGNTGIGSSDLRSAVTFVVNDRRVILVEGAFDTEDVAKRLEDTGHGVRKIRDTEVWSGDAGNVALMGAGRMAVGYDFTTMETVLVQLEDERTLDQVGAAREVLDRVQGTTYISLTTRCEDVASRMPSLGFLGIRAGQLNRDIRPGVVVRHGSGSRGGGVEPCSLLDHRDIVRYCHNLHRRPAVHCQRRG